MKAFPSCCQLVLVQFKDCGNYSPLRFLNSVLTDFHFLSMSLAFASEAVTVSRWKSLSRWRESLRWESEVSSLTRSRIWDLRSVRSLEGGWEEPESAWKKQDRR
jgi:hypothetical protein